MRRDMPAAQELRILLAKDLRRAWRNPLPWLINLIVPLAMTALIGMAFGNRSDSGGLGRIRFAVVDEDKSVLSDVLRGAVNQRQGSQYLEPVFLEREAALRLVNQNKISAVLIVPAHFLQNYLAGREPVSLELIKNPAESIHPAVLEELLGAVTAALNAVARNFRSEFPEWQKLLDGQGDYRQVARLIEQAGDKLKTLRKFVDPPLVSYQKEGPDGEASSPEAKAEVQRAKSAGNLGAGAASPNSTTLQEGTKKRSSRPTETSNLFAYLLVGMAGMFLLFLGHTAMTDLLREQRFRTLERYQTMHDSLLPFITGKVVFAVVMLLVCSAIMLGGGGLIFRIPWRQPVPLAMLSLGYAGFVTTLFAALVALVPDERRAAVLFNLVGMMLGILGGCAFPPENLPTLIRTRITPLMPSHWFVEAARHLQFDGASAGWEWVVLKLIGMSVGLIILAAFLFRRKYRSGLRA
jgi:ABC-type multidrug transport system permease subunit